MTSNVFYRKNQDHIFGDFTVAGSMVQIHALYNRPKPGAMTVEFYKLQPTGLSKFYKNKGNTIRVNGTDTESLKQAVNTYFKNQVITTVQIKDSFDD